MKRCSSCKTEKPVTEFNKNRSKKDGLANECRPCSHAVVAAWRAKNAERIRASQKKYCRANAARQRAKTAAWRHANPERATEGDRRWREANKGRVAESGRTWRTQNKDRLRETKRQYRLANRERINAANKEWRQNNRGTVLADRALRKARKRQATPPWLTEEQRAEMRELYKESVRLSDETGIPHHVDHEIPLAGRNVCGLHVPWNLQILPAFVNLQKGNTA